MEEKQISFSNRIKIVIKWMKLLGFSLLIISGVLFVAHLEFCSGFVTSRCSDFIYNLCLGTLFSPLSFSSFLSPRSITGCLDLTFNSFLNGILLIICARLLLKKKKLGWVFSIALLLISILPILRVIDRGIELSRIVDVESGFFTMPMLQLSIIISIPYLVPLIFLILDRKEFFRIAE